MLTWFALGNIEMLFCIRAYKELSEDALYRITYIYICISTHTLLLTYVFSSVNRTVLTFTQFNYSIKIYRINLVRLADKSLGICTTVDICILIKDNTKDPLFDNNYNNK